MKKVFRDIALEMSKKQPQMVDQITEEAPILEALPMEASSHGLQNVYEQVNSIDGAGLLELDDELPEVGADSELKQVDLSILGGVMYIGEDKAKRFAGANGSAAAGAARYFASKLPLILRETGMSAERSIIYNNLRAYALANSNLINIGGSAGANYTILAVKYVPGEINGLYDPAGFGRSLLMDIQPISGGNLFPRAVTRADGTARQVLSYGTRLKSYFGIQLANPRYVAAAVNIDLTLTGSPAAYTKMISEMQLDDLCDRVRATPGNTYLYMHSKVKTALFGYKGARLQTEVQVGDLNRTLQSWNGIPIIDSYNFLQGTEPNVT